MKTVVQDAKDLLVIAVPGLSVRQLIDVDQFVEQNHHAVEPCVTDEASHQLQVVVD